MAKIEWSESLSMGVAELDAHHKEILRIMSMLLDALNRGKDEDAITLLLSKLREYTLFHFAAEEAFMKQIEFPERRKHIARHVELKRKVKAFQYARFHHEELTSEDYKKFLSAWLLEHILDYDFKIIKYLQERKVAPDSLKDEGKAILDKVESEVSEDKKDQDEEDTKTENS
ncbi:bacteriohemerythrin [Maridesulfovibrio ferrireducens]|uniref:bacteriohemerythrin n=1 Tax=Maridesulfovibrio ferrireducens TaxID=246191 RepID=UPI001A28777C|nr:bacteriohemerythrin [Maridesulfovibrio ferrireducens]MBI9111807.1 hemerythrin family protein [Maridesulfovibrio ferrireducens]